MDLNINDPGFVPGAGAFPDGLPQLSSGKHQPGQGKACVMEYVSVLAGLEFSDFPECTHPGIARIAQIVNDSLIDQDRHLMIPFISRLASAGGQGRYIDEAMCEAFGTPPYMAIFVWDHLQAVAQATVFGGGFADSYILSADADSNMVVEISMASMWAPKAGIDFLDKVLRAYEQAVGSPTPEPVSAEALAKARELITSGLV